VQESQAREDEEDDDSLSVPSYNQASSNQSSAEKAYIESNNSKKQLFLMCVSLTDRGCSSVFDLDADPWKLIKKQDIKPTRFEYAMEVCRRGTIFEIQHIPKTANWSPMKCIEWREVNPIKDELDVLF
jgi:hypothetical protein